MHARPFHLMSDVNRFGSAPADRQVAPAQILTLGLAPVAVDQRRGPGQDAGLWTLVEHLTDADRLTIAWRFRRECKFRPELVLRLETMSPASAAVPSGDLGHGAALARAATLALPGFVAYTPEAASHDHWGPVAAPGIDAFDPHRAHARKPAVAGLALPERESLLLPARPITKLDLGAAIGALAELDEEITLELTLSRFAVDAPYLRMFERADASLFTRLYRDAKDPLETQRLEALRSYLGFWRRATGGIRCEVALTASEPIDPDLGELTARLLHGPGTIPAPGGPGPSAPMDLRGCLPLDVTDRPRLLPDPNRLAELMLTRQAPLAIVVSDGLVIGRDAADRPVVIGPSDRARHMFIIGATGVGKSTLLARMILQDIAHNRSVILIDPHGDLHALVRDALPREAAARVIIADAGDFAAPFGLNLLEITSEPAAVQRNFIANQLMAIFQSVLYRGVPEAFGPMFGAYFRNTLFLLMEVEGEHASLADFDRVFAEPAYRRSLLERCADPQVLRFWKGIAQNASGEAALSSIAPYICSKLTQFTGNPLLAPIITAPRTTLDFPGAMASSGIVLVNLAKGLVGEQDAALLGGLITIRIFCAALARATLPPAHRKPVRLYLDEFATYATDTLAQMLAECRKFGLELVLAGQSLDQVDGHGGRPDVAHAILANVGSILAFRTGPNDAHRLANWFAPDVSPSTLARLPDHRLIARLLQNGVPSEAMPVWTGSP